MRKEVLVLVALVLLVDAIFVAAYFLGRLPTASDTGKLVFTTVWTVVTLCVVIWGLARVRSARPHRGEPKPR
jgi:type VI protein secretion system component VasK